MCGIAALLNLNQPATPSSNDIIDRMRDRIAHRGPDDAGTWRGKWGSIAHRRLSVIDPGPAGHQPMHCPDDRYILAYNGELYNDLDLRSELATLGVRFRTNCDTETILHALIQWGDQALERIRGMYAFVFLDTLNAKATIARDPLGIKPLYFSTINQDQQTQLAIASEIPALLEHPAVSNTPDPVTLSAYLTTVRTTLGPRTMFQQIQTLEPGDWITIDLSNPSTAQHRNWWDDNADRSPTQALRQTIEDSVHRHLRTDVPMCALLSGGLDSAITTTIARRSLDALNTYCAGARTDGFDDDFKFAAQLAKQLGTTHHEVAVTQDDFTRMLPELITKMGNPMSTPNTIAIFAVAKALRKQGHIVTISGEGADELFAGYTPIMQQCAARVASLPDPKHDPEGGLFHLHTNAWISKDLKPGVLNQTLYEAAHEDQLLSEHYQSTFAQLSAQSNDTDPLQTHLRFQRRMNLPNLLQRLDVATMLAGVEGRTPFADIEVAIAAESLPMDRKFINDSLPQTKIALREAFAPDLPDEIVNRPKASFPLPFQNWMAPFADLLFESPFSREVFHEQSLSLVAANPNKYWHMAWPMVNIALWGHTCVMGEPIDTQRLTHASAC